MSVPIGRLFLSSSLVDPRAPLPRSTPRAGGRWAGRAHERPREARGARCAVGWCAGVRASRTHSTRKPLLDCGGDAVTNHR